MSSLARKSLRGQEATIYNLNCNDIISNSITARLIISPYEVTNLEFVDASTQLNMPGSIDVRKGVIILSGVGGGPFNLPSGFVLNLKIGWLNLDSNNIEMIIIAGIKRTSDADDYLQIKVANINPIGVADLRIINTSTSAYVEDKITIYYHWI